MTKYAMPIDEQPRPRLWTVIFVTVLMLASIAVVTALLEGSREHREYVPVATVDGIGIYIVTDPITDMQYLVTDRGGICPRYDRYGQMEADDGQA